MKLTTAEQRAGYTAANSEMLKLMLASWKRLTKMNEAESLYWLAKEIRNLAAKLPIQLAEKITKGYESECRKPVSEEKAPCPVLSAPNTAKH